MKTLALLWPYLRPYRRILWRGVIWLVATTALALVVPWMLKLGIEAVERGEYRVVLVFTAALALAALVRGGTRIASRLCFLHTARHVEISLRGDMLARLLHQTGAFFDAHRTGDLLSRFTNDLANVRMLSGFGIMTIINALIVYVFTLTVMIGLSPSLTLIAILPYPFMLMAVKVLSRLLHYHSARAQEGMARVSEAVEEGVSGQAVIRAYNMAARRTAHFDRLNTEYLERNLVLARLRATVMPIMTVVGPIGTLLVLYFGGKRVIAGSFSLGDFVAFNAYLLQLAWPTLLLGWVLTLLQRAAASLDRLQVLLRLQPPPAQLPAPGADARPPALEVRRLSYAYDREPVLSEISLRIPAGTVLGVTGGTASGKSTLLRLLAGLYPIEPGTILIDGRDDLAELDLRLWRQRVATVPQEGRLFSGTVRENLLYAEPGATEERLREITRLVQFADEIAHFPAGYETRVGEGGMSLSGGQRQRVSIGRALVRQAGLYLLDDPFSHLDAVTARQVWENLTPVLADKTVVLASGRVSLLAGADQIVVLENGSIVQQGAHAQLLRRGGLYARLYRREQLRDEMEEKRGNREATDI